MAKQHLAKLINIEKVREFAAYLNGLPWTYEPSVEEMVALNLLRDTIEDYQNFVQESK